MNDLLEQYKQEHPLLSGDEIRTLKRFVEYTMVKKSKKKPKTIRCTGCFSKFTSLGTLTRHIVRYHEVGEGKEIWITEQDKAQFTRRFKRYSSHI